MAGEPAEDVSPVSALRENIPDGFDLARSAGGWAHTSGLRIRLHEAVDAMLIGALAGGYRVPQHRRKNRTQSRQVANDATIDKVIERGHKTLVQKGIDQLPVGSIPADQENFFGERSTHVIHDGTKNWETGLLLRLVK